MDWLDALHDAIGDTWIQFVPSVLIGFLVVIPATRLLKRVGMSRAWALLSFFPPWLGLVVLVWVVAFSSWKPADTENPSLPRGIPP